MNLDTGTPPAATPETSRSRARPAGRRTLVVAVVGWIAANMLVGTGAGDPLPFDWPARTGLQTWEVLVETYVALAQVFLMMLVVRWLTRRRPAPEVADRSPERARAHRETLGLLVYGACGLVGGYVLARAMGWHPFGLHLAGTIFGTHAHLGRLEVVAWAAYNFVDGASAEQRSDAWVCCTNG